MKRFLPFLTAAALAVPIATFAADTAADQLRQHVTTFQPLLLQFQADQDLDASEMSMSANEEIFAVTPEEESLSQRPTLEDEGFVSFRIAGVPYLLRDVPLSIWFAPYVRDVAERGIVSGYRNAEGIPTGIFGPERNVSIEELAKMALEAAKLTKTGCGEPLNVAAHTSWSADYIACSEKAGLAVYSDGTVDIKRPATRAEVVMTILQAFGAQLKDLPPSGSSFSDVTASTLFAPAIYTASADGIVAGYTDASGNLTGTFGPANPVNRAEVAKIISLGLQVYGK